MPYNEFPQPEQNTSWDDLQRFQSPEAGLDDVAGITPNPTQKEASWVGKELINSHQDSLYANTQLLNEQLEIDRHVQRLIDEKQPYIIIEKSIRQMGYQVPNIRRSFHKITGIDPVRAYLDFATYTSPPGAVPRYNYGWGEAKDAASDYYFVLPYIDKYAVYKLTGLEREIVSEYYFVKDAREDLKKRVKSFRDVTPDVADVLTDIIQKVAQFTKLSSKGATFYLQAQKWAEHDMTHVAKAAMNALEEGQITKEDFRILAETVILAAPQEPSTRLTAPERADEGQFQEFRDMQDGRSFREMRNNTLIPGQEFASNWESQHKVDFWGLLTESREIFSELSSTIQGYKVEPSWGTFKIMPQPNLAVDDDNHILDGSVAVGATVQRLGGMAAQSEIALLMFIHNGKLKYSGKFKGVNEREYAFTTMGLGDYFDDLEGSTALEERIEHGIGSDLGPGIEQNSPLARP